MRATDLSTTSARRAGRVALASLVVAIVMGPSAAFATPTPQEGTPGRSRADPIGLCQPITPEVSLPDDGAELQWADQVYGVQTNYLYWSVVATRGSQGYNPDLALNPSPANLCNIMGASLNGQFSPTDWVAWDNNGGRYRTGPYVTSIFGHAGNAPHVQKYMVQFVRGSQTLTTASPLTEQPVGRTGDWVVDIRDILLYPGVTYTFTVTGGVSAVYLLRSDTADSATWAQTGDASTPSLVMPGTDLDVPQTATFTVTPTQASWYGALFVRNGWWGVPTTVRISTS